ncbi:polyprenyl synthetase family protein [Peribacillus tepidiphilus]|uniref:polyprenyl synthetase family protein n=1 Tax=Peribacillus tepidiphilus TaxID=2652445 RepID=UPI001291530D|nr:farnesyl diphosphate synthase [Peribacillus tepidiphilus]
MTSSSFKEFTSFYKKRIDEKLVQYVNELTMPATLKKSMIYSLEAGGKRIRPLLLFAVLKSFQKDIEMGLPAACALEMIHTYSLIHDDLPSMDDDDLRRGKPTNHKVFGEAMAILAGDALLTYSFQILAEMKDISPEQRLSLITLIAKSAGAEGMVGGQTADMEGEGKQLTLEELEYIHKNKTGKLLSASVMAGAILAEANDEQKHHLERFAYHIGLAFQIRDDILDIEGNEEQIGKPVGSDEINNKSTYPSLLTLDGAKEKLREEMEAAKQHLENAHLEDPILFELMEFIGKRVS